MSGLTNRVCPGCGKDFWAPVHAGPARVCIICQMERDAADAALRTIGCSGCSGCANGQVSPEVGSRWGWEPVPFMIGLVFGALVTALLLKFG